MTAITLVACTPKHAVPTAVPTLDSEENQETLRKLEGYIACLNEAAHTFDAADSYRERYSTHPPLPTDDTPVQPASDPDDCTGNVLRSVALEPRLPEIDAAGRAYLDALTATYAISVAMHDEFDHTSRRYNPTAGIALHGPMLAAFDRFDAAQAGLFDQVFALNHKIHADQLSRRTKQEGRTLPVIAEELSLRAEALVPFASVASDRIDSIDVDAMAAAIVAYQSSLDEIAAYGELHPKDAEAVLKGYWELRRSAQAYLFAARELAARARQHLPYTDAEKLQIVAHDEAAVVGTPAAMIDAYNHLRAVYTPVGTWPL